MVHTLLPRRAQAVFFVKIKCHPKLTIVLLCSIEGIVEGLRPSDVDAGGQIGR